MTTPHLKKSEVKIEGMTCNSCEIILERKLKTIKGIVAVNVNHKTGIVNITADADMLKETSKEAVSRLKEMGLELYMITGDNKRTAHALAMASSSVSVVTNSLLLKGFHPEKRSLISDIAPIVMTFGFVALFFLGIQAINLYLFSLLMCVSLVILLYINTKLKYEKI
ncbi:MAG: heavy metal translocating P-type ATPase [Patescibacteria group bacterium]